jgi:transcriptional regulator with XRE-family HTH domain
VYKCSKMKETLADRIQLLRKQAGLTQIELADQIGVSKSQFIRYESKNVQPPADTLNKLANVLGTSVDYLISGDKNEKAKASLKNSELLQRFKEIDALPEPEQNILIKVISAYIRDFKAKQAYAQ